MGTRIIQARKAGDIAQAAREGARVLRSGGLVGFATETVYGLGAVASLPETMERLRELKSRPARPFSVHIATPKDAFRYVSEVSDEARRLMRKGWPGPLTLLLPTGGRLADERLQRAGLAQVLCHQGVIGIRCPRHALATEMLSAVDGPVVAPSANRAGERSPRTAEDVSDALAGRIDLLIDSGPTEYGADSTIVSFDSDGYWKIVRNGVYDARMVRRMIGRTYLFVCTGSTCRSPIAAGLARKMLAEKLGVTPGKLKSRGIEVLAAGVYAPNGASPTLKSLARIYPIIGGGSSQSS